MLELHRLCEAGTHTDSRKKRTPLELAAVARFLHGWMKYPRAPNRAIPMANHILVSVPGEERNEAPR